MRIPARKKQAFQRKILSWYKGHKRDLPWRKTRDPYAILVSEIMLQQTQVERVIGYYNRFMKKFPTLEKLARAQKKTLLSYWSGLGYNSRVLRLQQLAKVVRKEYKGMMPGTEEELLALPGIGPYTANAVLSFAFNKPSPVVDTNIRRVFIHELKLKEDISMEELKTLSLDLIPEHKSCIWYNALMDYGAMEKTARKTGITSLSRQGTFEGSDRWIRGSIVRRLLKEKALSISVLQKEFNPSQLTRVLQKMKREGILCQQQSKILLA